MSLDAPIHRCLVTSISVLTKHLDEGKIVKVGASRARLLTGLHAEHHSDTALTFGREPIGLCRTGRRVSEALPFADQILMYIEKHPMVTFAQSSRLNLGHTLDLRRTQLGKASSMYITVFYE